MDRRFWVAIKDDEPLRSNWLQGGLQEAAERWTDAAQYIDATEMSDYEFEYLVVNKKPLFYCGGVVVMGKVVTLIGAQS